MVYKCPLCKKKFESISSLREHHRAVHPNARFVAPGKELLTKTTILTIIIAGLVVTGGVVGYLIYAQASQNSSHSTSILNSPISPSIYQDLSGVSISTLSAIGPNQSLDAPLTPIPSTTSPQLLSDNKPEILYIGAEWCPYCAAERWALAVALEKFGNLSGVQYMQSAEDDGNIATLSFRNANYTSNYISFVPVEHEDRNHNTLETPTGQEQDLWSSYTSGDLTIPFIYIYGHYILTGSQYSYNIIAGLNWTQIASQLNDSSSSVAQAIDGAANQIIGSICISLQNRNWATPSLCGQSFAQDSYNGKSLIDSGNFLPLQVSSQPFKKRNCSKSLGLQSLSSREL